MKNPETSTRSEAEILTMSQIPETSTRSEEEILANPQIPGTSTRSEVKILGNQLIPETSTRSQAEFLGIPRFWRQALGLRPEPLPGAPRRTEYFLSFLSGWVGAPPPLW